MAKRKLNDVKMHLQTGSINCRSRFVRVLKNGQTFLLTVCPLDDNLPSDDNDNTTATQNHLVSNSQKRADLQAKKGILNHVHQFY